MTTRDKALKRSNKRVLASRGGKASPKPDMTDSELIDYFLKRESIYREALEKMANIYEELASDMRELANKTLKGV